MGTTGRGEGRSLPVARVMRGRRYGPGSSKWWKLCLMKDNRPWVLYTAYESIAISACLAHCTKWSTSIVDSSGLCLGDTTRRFSVHLPLCAWRETSGFCGAARDHRRGTLRGLSSSGTSFKSCRIGTWPPKRKVHGRPRAPSIKALSLEG